MTAQITAQTTTQAATPLTLLDLLAELGMTWGDWRADAACSLADVDLLDPIAGTRPTETELANREYGAWLRCSGCPVRRECGLAADALRDQGVRGGSLRYVSGGVYVVQPLIPHAEPSNPPGKSLLLTWVGFDGSVRTFRQRIKELIGQRAS